MPPPSCRISGIPPSVGTYTTDPGGNKERIAFVYDTRAVQFTGMAAESDGPRKKNKTTGQYVPKFNWWRKPYMASFKAGNFDFVMLAVHLQWGTTAGRKEELAPHPSRSCAR